MYTAQEISKIQDFAKEIRIHILEQMATRGFGHLGRSEERRVGKEC